MNELVAAVFQKTQIFVVLQSHLFILICCDCDELALLEHVRPEGGVGKLHDITGSDKVEAGLVLVHRIQNRLEGKKRDKRRMRYSDFLYRPSCITTDQKRLLAQVDIIFSMAHKN